MDKIWKVNFKQKTRMASGCSNTARGRSLEIPVAGAKTIALYTVDK